MKFFFKNQGNFSHTEALLQRCRKLTKPFLKWKLEKYGKLGCDALIAATPKDSGETAKHWSYIIVETDDSVALSWTNDHVNKGVNIAFIIQYGHGTGTGGYVAGYDYINPALKPIFDKIGEDIWKEVTGR